jgi:endonuclease YncB( thermonuclease family)
MGNCCHSKPTSTSRARSIGDPCHTNDLLCGSFEHLTKFTFKGLVTKAKIVDVYDGDTITIVFYYHDIPIKDNFRLFGYDAPELKPLKTTPNRDLHVKAGLFVKDYMRSQFLGKIVWVKFIEEEKYGRLMGYLYPMSEQVFSDQIESVNQMMIRKGFGLPYDGGHKSEFTLEQLNTILEAGDTLSPVTPSPRHPTTPTN